VNDGRNAEQDTLFGEEYKSSNFSTVRRHKQ
jgi:hypothetical protein